MAASATSLLYLHILVPFTHQQVYRKPPQPWAPGSDFPSLSSLRSHCLCHRAVSFPPRCYSASGRHPANLRISSYSSHYCATSYVQWDNILEGKPSFYPLVILFYPTDCSPVKWDIKIWNLTWFVTTDIVYKVFLNSEKSEFWIPIRQGISPSI